MDVFDKFFKRYSYKFPKGYPDMKNGQDVLLLENILYNLLKERIVLNEEFNSLKFSDLQKYGGPRLKKVADKIKDDEPFDMISGEQVILKFNKPEYKSLFANADIEGLKSLAKTNINSFPFFKDKNNKTYVVGDLLKNKDFGGKGGGSGTRVEDIALEDVNGKLQELGSINVKLSPNGEVYKDIIGAATVNGTPKADFTFDNKTGPVIFISHKDGKGPRDFQQYSGFQGLSDFPEIKSFVEDVRAKTGGELKSGDSFRRKIKDPLIKLKAVYGLDQNVGNYEKNNCQVILQGPIDLKLDTKDNVYLVEANHKVINPNLPKGDYEPYMYVTFRSDRNNEGIKNARFGTYPEAYKRNAPEI
jgi:hypothetical protein